jgi:hypothetical protein
VFAKRTALERTSVALLGACLHRTLHGALTVRCFIFERCSFLLVSTHAILEGVIGHILAIDASNFVDVDLRDAGVSVAATGK